MPHNVGTLHKNIKTLKRRLPRDWVGESMSRSGDRLTVSTRRYPFDPLEGGSQRAIITKPTALRDHIERIIGLFHLALCVGDPVSQQP